jgi:RNA polymerase sigma-70 factor (ECF subfamily)
MPHSAIAERLGIPLGTVKSRLRLAFARLRPVLEDLR